MPRNLPRITFHGAAGTVTGSCFLVETDTTRILVDCGMFQGSKTEKELNYRPFPFAADAIDAMVLTHAHIDHSGLIPKLVKAGFEGPIYATAATVDLCSVMLPDSGHIQELEVEQLNRRNMRRGQRPVDPIYTAEDAQAAMDRFRPVSYQDWVSVSAGIRARWWNAGHLLGSASIEMEIAPAEGGDPVRVLFSGDLGSGFKLLQPDPEAPTGVDYVICESTYGDTDRKEVNERRRRDMLCAEVKAAYRPGGALLIPSFAVERTQEVLVDLTRLMEEKCIPTVPIYIDSPLATRATAIFERHAREMTEGGALVSALRSHHVRFTESVEQSKALDRLRDFHIVIAASGMCEAGRIRHRLKNWLWREEATVLIVGYQAAGTLGRILLDGASSVRIQGDEIKVRARIRSLDVYSGHADGPELAAWVQQRMPIARGVFLVHGEDDAVAGLRERLAGFLPADRIVTPSLDETFELSDRGAHAVETNVPHRIGRAQLAHLDWHNDLSKLLLDISDTVGREADERGRAVVIRRLRSALENGERPRT